MSTVQPHPTLELDLPAEALPGFASLLQHGVLFPIAKPIPLLSFLVTLPGFSADYIEENVQTIFIDGVAADNLNKEMVDGTTVALSAAMPGLAGAIFRRQGIHGSLRSKQVTDAPGEQSGAGFLTLKFFNSIATDRVEDLRQEPCRFCPHAGPSVRTTGLSQVGRTEDIVCRRTGKCSKLGFGAGTAERINPGGIIKNDYHSNSA